MNQGIGRVQLYDNRLYNFGEITNRYKDVYIDIEINGEVLRNISIEQLINNTYLGITDKEKRIIVNAAKRLVKDRDYNSYTIDVPTRKILTKQVFDY